LHQKTLKLKTRILILSLIIIFSSSCNDVSKKTETDEKSKFNFKTDYKEFKTKMSELDTLKVWMFIGACTYHTAEKLTITKKNDTLTILPEFKERAFTDDSYIKQKPISIHENDTIWKFGEFLDYYKLKNNKSKNKIPIFEIKSDTTSLKFYTKGIYQRDQIVGDYCIVMKQLIPNSKYHIFGEIIDLNTDNVELEITEIEKSDKVKILNNKTGIEINGINETDLIDYKRIETNRIIIFDKNIGETTQGKEIRIINENPQEIKGKIKFGFGFNQYTIDDNPAYPLDFKKQTEWIKLTNNLDKFLIPELYDNSKATEIYELLKFKNNLEIQEWVLKSDFESLKKQSIIEQKNFYNSLIKEKKKYIKCCPEYIEQANSFLMKNETDFENTIDLGLELIIKEVLIEIEWNVKGKRYKRMIIEK